MLRASLALLLLAVAAAAEAQDRALGPERWLLERRDGVLLPRDEKPTAATGHDPLSQLIAHVKRNPVGVRPLVTLMPPESGDERGGEPPTIAFFARAKGRTLISLTRVHARPDDGQEVVMQRTVVSDLFADHRFSLTVYEDHTIGDTTARLMGFGTRLTYRPSILPVRFEVLGAYDVDAGASGYLSITSVLGAPPLPPSLGR